MDRYEKATMDLAGAGVTVHRISTYRELGEYRDDWATGRLGALPLYVCSRPQLGKSRHFAQVPGALHLRIHASAWGIYHRLWRHQKEQVVLDDLDSLLQDIAANALLKALMEDSPCRQLTWTTDNAKINRGEVPPAFDFEGRIAVLSNSWPRDPAVLSRAFAIWFAPDVEEVHDYAKTWLPKDGSQIWNYVGERLQYVPAPDLNRWYVQPCRLASIGRDWRRYLDGMLDAPEIRCLVELENRAGLTRRQKAAQWAKQTGESARTYYRKLTAYRASHPERDDKQAARDWNTCQHDSIVSTGMQARPAAVMLPSIGNGPASDSARQGEIQPRDDDEMPGAEVAPAPKEKGGLSCPWRLRRQATSFGRPDGIWPTLSTMSTGLDSSIRTADPCPCSLPISKRPLHGLAGNTSAGRVLGIVGSLLSHIRSMTVPQRRPALAFWKRWRDGISGTTSSRMAR